LRIVLFLRLESQHDGSSDLPTPNTKGRRGLNIAQDGAASRKIVALILAAAVLASLAAWQSGLNSDDAQPEPEYVYSSLLDDNEWKNTANLRFADVDGDSVDEIMMAEPFSGRVLILDECPDCREITNLSDGLEMPLRAQNVDLNADGLVDYLVADIGSVYPTNQEVGRVVLMENDGVGGFTPVVLLDSVGRVACAEAADLDGDGDLDIVVCEFGHDNGSIMWLEQQDDFNFNAHVLDSRAGAIHAFPHDADGDGDLDIAAVISQITEEVILFRNQGNGNFSNQSLFTAGHAYFGMTGLDVVDLDRDGDEDLMFTNGAIMDGDMPFGISPNDLHGIHLLINDGTGNYIYEKMGALWGAYASTALDFDNDGDLDVVVSTHQTFFYFPREPQMGMIWLENDGEMGFTRHNLSDAPQYVITVDSGDLDGDGFFELIGGSYDIPSFENGSRLFTINSSIH